MSRRLDRAVDNGVKTLVVQPTHLMDGLEYTDLVDELAQYTDAFEHIAVGAPLLTSDGDFQAVADAITQATAQYDDGDTAICFMGHGTEAESNRHLRRDAAGARGGWARPLLCGDRGRRSPRWRMCWPG